MKRGARRPAGRKRKVVTKSKTKSGAKSGTKFAAKKRAARAKTAVKASNKAKTGRASKSRQAATARNAKTPNAKTRTAKTRTAKTRNVRTRNAGTPPRAKSAQAARTAPELAIGSAAPDFRLTRDGGATVMRDDFAGRNLVIFFYPRANTPGCTREAIDFTRLSNDFARADTDVIGVSADSIKAQESFRDGHNLTTPLLSDATREMLNAYGAWGMKSNYGKTYEGIIRSTVLIDRQGRVAQVWRNVRVDGHAEAVLQAARSL